MPSGVLIGAALGELGALICMIGFLVGLRAFRTWKFKRPFLSSEQALALFLGASGALEVIQAYLQHKHQQNLWCGALWDLAIILFLVPAITTPENWFAKLFSLTMTFAWMGYFLTGGKLEAFDTLFHPVLCMLMMLLADAVIVKHEWGVRTKNSLLSVILAVSILLGMALDVFPYSLSAETLSSESGVWIQGVRNGLWCVVYALMGFTLWGRG